MRKTIDDYFDEIDAARVERVRELSEMKRVFGANPTENDPLGVQSRALVVLSYAAWEGFYNECVDIYCNFLEAQGKKVCDVAWRLLVGTLSSEFKALRDRHHSPLAKRDFVENLQNKLSCDFTYFDRKTIKAHSNLNWDNLNQNFQHLQFDPTPFLPYRNKLDRELVGWRHAVAHGNAPDLNALDASAHISLVDNVMLLVADTFQSAMLDNL
jgi:hypothetical protein